MFDDPGDLDRNGIPDAIQADPVIVPGDEDPFDVFAPQATLPGSPNAQVTETPPPAPEVPAPPPPSTEMTEVQDEGKRMSVMMEMSNQVIKTIGEGLSEAARKQ